MERVRTQNQTMAICCMPKMWVQVESMEARSAKRRRRYTEMSSITDFNVTVTYRDEKHKKHSKIVAYANVDNIEEMNQLIRVIKKAVMEKWCG